MREIDIIWSPIEDDEEAVFVRTISDEEYAELEGGRIAAAERRLGVSIPAALRDQMVIQDGGQIGGPYAENIPFTDKANWGNAAVDGLLSLSDWTLPHDTDWFASFVVAGEPHLDKLVSIAHIAESFLCLDYRACGPDGIPSVVYIDSTYDPFRTIVLAETADAFVAALVQCNRQ